MSKLRTRIPALWVRLFRTTRQNISLRRQNIYAEGELQFEATHKESLSVRQEGGRTVRRRVDLSRTLQHPTQTGMLESTGARWAVYHLPGEAIATPDDVFGPPARISVPSSPNLGGSSPNLGENRDGDGCLVADQLPRLNIDELSALGPGLCARLDGIAATVRVVFSALSAWFTSLIFMNRDNKKRGNAF